MAHLCNPQIRTPRTRIRMCRCQSQSFRGGDSQSRSLDYRCIKFSSVLANWGPSTMGKFGGWPILTCHAGLEWRGRHSKLLENAYSRFPTACSTRIVKLSKVVWASLSNSHAKLGSEHFCKSKGGSSGNHVAPQLAVNGSENSKEI